MLLITRITVLLVAACTVGLGADQHGLAPTGRPPAHLPFELEELALETSEHWKKFESDGLGEEYHPIVVFADRLKELVRRDGNISFFASCYVLRHANGKLGEQERELLVAAIEELLRQHRDNPHLTAELQHIGRKGMVDVAMEPFLRELIAQSQSSTVKAGAAYCLGLLLDEVARVMEGDTLEARIRNLESVGLDVRQIEAVTQQAIVIEGAYAKTGINELRRQAEEFLESVVKEYPNEVPSVLLYKNDKTWVHKYVDDHRIRYGDLAAQSLFAMRKLRSGSPAPELTAVDCSGDKFRLSDYRGQVILLRVGNFRINQQANKRLLDHFADEPLVIINVVQSDRQTGSRFTDRIFTKMCGGTRCVLDSDGSICVNWSALGADVAYLIDGDGVIRHHPDLRNRNELKGEIRKLLDAR